LEVDLGLGVQVPSIVIPDANNKYDKGISFSELFAKKKAQLFTHSELYV